MRTVNYSIIIPHYDIPDLLMRCLKSIPVREDVQVIVVDDCSPGADKYLEQYPELSRPYLEFYSTPKGGSAGRARNVGLEHAKGKWLVFADADDFFVDDFGSILDKYIDKDVDIIYFNIECVLSNDITQKAHTKALNFKDYFNCQEIDEIEFRCHHPMPWGKFIRRNIVGNYNIRFDETRWSNDYFFSVNAGIKAKNISVSREVLYYITEREKSLSQEFCKTDKEMYVRAEVAFRVQTVIDHSDYPLSRPIFSDDLLRLFQRDKKTFVLYYKKTRELGYSHFKLIKHICKPCGLKDTFLITIYVISHCL